MPKGEDVRPGEINLDGFEVINEGKARIVVPKRELYKRPDGIFEPAWAPVFYNPVMADNRTLTVLASRVYRETAGEIRTFLEPLAGSCVRSLRILLEGGADTAYANDIDPLSVYICRLNARANGLTGRLIVFNEDANYFNYYMEKLGIPADFVDVDPYGTPIYYLQSSIKLIRKRGLISVTATDVGTLEGKYPLKAYLRYGVSVTKTAFSKELAARVLLYVISRLAAFQERKIEPLLTFYDKHYLKVIAKVKKASSSELGEVIDKTGYISIDERGLPINAFRLNDLPKYKSLGGSNLVGPVWIGPLCDRPFLEKLIYSSSLSDTPLSTPTLTKLKMLLSECDIEAPFYYSLPSLAKITNVNIPKLRGLLSYIQGMGYKSSRTHFDLMSIKTNAPLDEVIKALRILS